MNWSRDAIVAVGSVVVGILTSIKLNSDSLPTDSESFDDKYESNWFYYYR